jgi:hypothetical protein
MFTHGWDKSWISLNLPGMFFGISPRGEQTKFWNGGLRKGPAILSFSDSIANFSDYHLLGFTWNNLYYYERYLPMGASSSCQIFESFSSSLHWIMENKYCAAGINIKC